MKPGDKVIMKRNGEKAEIVRVNRNGTVRVAYWVCAIGKPEIWQETVKQTAIVTI